MPRTVVAPPPVFPTRHGLIVSAFEPADPSARWETGYHYQPDVCAAPGSFPICPTAKTPADVAYVEDARPYIDGEPLDIEIGYRCSTTEWRNGDFEPIARRLLEAGQSRTLEYLFGSNPDAVATPYLQDPATVQVIPQTNAAADQPYSPSYGVALLAQALANTGAGGQGMIHVTPLVEAALWAAGQVYEDSGKLRHRVGGHIIVVGSGYDANGPGGIPDPDANHWLYATGPVVVRLGDINARGDQTSINRDDNTVAVIADRTATVYFDTCSHYGVLVDPGKDWRS